MNHRPLARVIKRHKQAAKPRLFGSHMLTQSKSVQLNPGESAQRAVLPRATTIFGFTNSICLRKNGWQLVASLSVGVELLPFSSFGLHRTALVTKMSLRLMPAKLSKSSKFFLLCRREKEPQFHQPLNDLVPPHKKQICNFRDFQPSSSARAHSGTSAHISCRHAPLR